jgi:hypothetical protein
MIVPSIFSPEKPEKPEKPAISSPVRPVIFKSLAETST